MSQDQIRTNLITHEDVSTSYFLATTDNFGTAATKIAGKVGHTLHVIQITVAVTVDAAKSQTFQDSAGTPVVAAAVKASPGLGAIVFDFGPNGFALTEGKDLQHKNNGAGLGAAVAIMAYRKRTTGLSIT